VAVIAIETEACCLPFQMILMEMDSLIRARRAIADDATDPHQVARTS